MKNTLIKITGIALSLALALSAAGCRENKRKIPGWEEGKQNVVFYVWGSPEEDALLQSVIDDFEAENEEINVIISKSANDYYDDLEYMIAGTNTPDIVQMKPGYIQPFLRNNALESLQPYIEASTAVTEEMIWDTNDAYRYDTETKTIGTGDYYSLIKDFSPDYILTYDKNDVDANRNALMKLDYPKQEGTAYPSETEPMTWSQFKAFAETLQTANRMGTHLDNEPFQQLLQWIQQSGESLYSEDHKTVKDIKNTEGIRKSFDYYRELRDECTDNTPVAKNSSVQVGGGQLKEDQTSSLFIGRWAAVSFGWDSVSTLNVGYAPTPVPDGMTAGETDKYCGVTAMVGLSISAKSTVKDAAWKFIEYYYTEGLKGLAEEGYNIPGNKTIAQDYFCGEAEDSSISEEMKKVNDLFYDYALNNSFAIEFNKYMSQVVVEQVLGTNFSQYFASSKGKPFDLSLWEQTLDSIQRSLQGKLDDAVKLYA